MTDYELKGKTAIITGGSDGLGRAAAKKLAQEGANVIMCAQREKHLMDASKSIAVSDQAGTLSPGRPGDVLVVGGDPTSDLNALWDVKDVYKSGIRVERPV